ncbi:MAG: hypothetical protein KBH45_02160 [Verrucomicrobia bacterium]|nr:hypothetical protein [Verrucomicrobiota bacterium]
MKRLREKKLAHERFWHGEGPCLLLLPTAAMEQYDLAGYRERFENPELMWQAEMRRARPVVDWPTDGIPTVRPNLGVVFIPAIAGAGYRIEEGSMPWPGEPLTRDAIRTVKQRQVAATRLMQLAREFYAIHEAGAESEIAAYHPDTQGVFDIAHLLAGEEIFLQLSDEPDWVRELMELCLDLYVQVSRELKATLRQPAGEMIHGHGTPQGVFFPHAGVRISEDTPTLLSSKMLAEVVLPFIARAAEPFGGCFVHYCGRHHAFFEQLCNCSAVRAIDLGNSELYELRWLLEKCATGNKVLYSRIAAQPGEDWRTYLQRIAAGISATGARVILRPMVFPETRNECQAMLDLWHELTA